MYSDLDIVYAYITDSANYSRQSYQKMVEKSIENEIGESHIECKEEKLDLLGKKHEATK